MIKMHVFTLEALEKMFGYTPGTIVTADFNHKRRVLEFVVDIPGKGQRSEGQEIEVVPHGISRFCG